MEPDKCVLQIERRQLAGRAPVRRGQLYHGAGLLLSKKIALWMRKIAESPVDGASLTWT
jgi:hypothetical protein